MVSGFKKEDLRSLLSVAVKQSFFIFDGKYYQQSDGVSMGSSLGPSMANAFLVYYENQWLDSCPNNIKPSVFKRYVDDIFVLFQNNTHLKEFETYLSSKHPNIRFTSKSEKDGMLDFLDISLTRCNDKFVTSIYKKPMASEIYSHFESFIHHKMKYSLVWTMLFRVFSICSNWTVFHKNLDSLKTMFIKNGYPLTFIDSVIRRFLLSKYNTGPKIEIPTVPKKDIFIVLPYVGKISLQVRSKLNKYFKTFYPCLKLKLSFKTTHRVKNFFQFKDRIPTDLKSCVIYKFKCSTCNSTYYGKTIQHFHHRVSEHLGVSDLTGQNIKGKSYFSPTSITTHAILEDHPLQPDDFSILTSARNSFEVLLKEDLLRARDRPEINIQMKTPYNLKLF